MNPNEVLKLKDMIQEGNCVDNTETIRQLKHSALITQNLNTILRIKKKYKNDIKEIDAECLKECRFLFDNYTNIYNKLIRDQIDLVIFYKFLHYLKKIEDGELTFYQASYEIGCLLKNMYVDPIVEKDDNTEKKVKDVTWNDYKMSIKNNIDH